jgi:hypothetical protein
MCFEPAQGWVRSRIIERRHPLFSAPPTPLIQLDHLYIVFSHSRNQTRSIRFQERRIHVQTFGKNLVRESRQRVMVFYPLVLSIVRCRQNLPELPNTPPTSTMSASRPRRHHPAIRVIMTRYGPDTTQSSETGKAAR